MFSLGVGELAVLAAICAFTIVPIGVVAFVLVRRKRGSR